MCLLISFSIYPVKFLEALHVDILVLIIWIYVPDQFIKYFGKYGEITDSVIMKDRSTGQPRGFGFVTYADSSVVDRVIEETHIINGKQVGILIFWKMVV